MPKKSIMKRVIRFILVVFAAIWMVFEEWVWDSILAVMEVVGRLRIIQSIERSIAAQSPYLLLALFSVPFMLMLPAKLYGLYLIGNGHMLRGVAIFVLAKVTVTALVTRLFVIGKKKLLTIQLFAAFYFWFDEKKEWLYREVRSMPAWQTAKAWMASAKAKLRSLRQKIAQFTHRKP